MQHQNPHIKALRVGANKIAKMMEKLFEIELAANLSLDLFLQYGHRNHVELSDEGEYDSYMNFMDQDINRHNMEPEEHKQKIDIPGFSGDSNIENFQNRQQYVIRFCYYMDIPNEKMVKLVPYRLKGEASVGEITTKEEVRSQRSCKILELNEVVIENMQTSCSNRYLTHLIC